MRSAESRDAAKKPTGLGRGSKAHSALVLTAVTLALFATVVALQWRGGAFTAEFSGYPDEASHYLSGLLVRNYIAAGFPGESDSICREILYSISIHGFRPLAALILRGRGRMDVALFSRSRLSDNVDGARNHVDRGWRLSDGSRRIRTCIGAGDSLFPSSASTGTTLLRYGHAGHAAGAV